MFELKSQFLLSFKNLGYGKENTLKLLILKQGGSILK